MARLPLPDRESLDPAMQERWDRTAARGPVLNIMRLLMLNPQLELNALSVWQGSGLDARKRELVILRAAYDRQSKYEWHQHVRIARNEGLSDDEINAVKNWQDSPLFDADERALLAYVDDLARNPRPSDETFQAVSKGRTPADVLGVTFLATLYFQLAQIMAAMDLETEVPFVGWDVK